MDILFFAGKNPHVTSTATINTIRRLLLHLHINAKT